jgi:RNA polymerase sigma factor (TIGR02999 family)
MLQSHPRTTEIVRELAGGRRENLDELIALLYDDLRRMAARFMASERRDHTLQPTAIINEAYVHLVDQRVARWEDRAHFLSVAGRIIRRILVDHARARESQKRGGAGRRERLSGIQVFGSNPEEDIDLLALDEALESLAKISARQAQVVELRYFAGLSIPEIAEVLSIGERSVSREWSGARAWLYRELSGEGDAR